MVVVFAIFIAIGYFSSQRSTEFSFHLHLFPCGSSIIHEGYSTECGTIVLPQEYAVYDDGTLDLPDVDSDGGFHFSSNTPTVELPLIVFTPALETGTPLVFTGAGGPGGTTFLSMHDSIDVNDYLDGFRASTVGAGRKLIMLDVRGSFGTKPFLDCHDYTKLIYKQMVTGRFKTQERLDVDEKCAEEIKSKRINLGLFNIDNAVRDIEAIRHLFDINEWHVYGVSHGTRIAMHYARLFPQNTKSLILDSIFPFDIDSSLDYAALNEKALLQAFNRCDANHECAERLGGNTSDSLIRLREDLKINPLLLTSTHINDEFDSVTETITVTENTIDRLLFSASYDEDVLSTLPDLVKQMEIQNYEPFLQFFASEMEYAMFGMFADVAFTSFSCYEEDLFLDIEQAIKNAEYVALDSKDSIDDLRYLTSHCHTFEVTKAEYSIKSFDLRTLEMPILILAGALDIATPSYWAEEFYNELPHKGVIQHLKIWPEEAHAVLNGNECADALVANFLDNPTKPLNDISPCSD